MELDLVNLLLVLLAAWLAGNLAERFRYPSVLGELLAGISSVLPCSGCEDLTMGMGMNGRGAVEVIAARIGLERGLITQEVFPSSWRSSPPPWSPSC